MYVNPFVLGVLATVVIELITLFGLAIVKGLNRR